MLPKAAVSQRHRSNAHPTPCTSRPSQGAGRSAAFVGRKRGSIALPQGLSDPGHRAEHGEHRVTRAAGAAQAEPSLRGPCPGAAGPRTHCPRGTPGPQRGWQGPASPSHPMVTPDNILAPPVPVHLSPPGRGCRCRWAPPAAPSVCPSVLPPARPGSAARPRAPPGARRPQRPHGAGARPRSAGRHFG